MVEDELTVGDAVGDVVAVVVDATAAVVVEEGEWLGELLLDFVIVLGAKLVGDNAGNTELDAAVEAVTVDAAI